MDDDPIVAGAMARMEGESIDSHDFPKGSESAKLFREGWSRQNEEMALDAACYFGDDEENDD